MAMSPKNQNETSCSTEAASSLSEGQEGSKKRKKSSSTSSGVPKRSKTVNENDSADEDTTSKSEGPYQTTGKMKNEEAKATSSRFSRLLSHVPDSEGKHNLQLASDGNNISNEEFLHSIVDGMSRDEAIRVLKDNLSGLLLPPTGICISSPT